LPFQKGGHITEWQSGFLRPSQGIEIECKEISKYIDPSGILISGFVVIDSNRELDVVAVYTAAGATGQVETIHTERVPARKIQ
jgi:hypothetical protein